MKRLISMVIVLLVISTLAGCIPFNPDPMRADIAQLQTDLTKLQTELNSTQAELNSTQAELNSTQTDLANYIEQNRQYEALLQELLLYWNEREDTRGILVAEFTAVFGGTYSGVLTMDNYEDVYQLVLTERTTFTITVVTDRRLDINIWIAGENDWFDYYVFEINGAPQTITLEAGTYLFEVQNWYDYSSVNYSIRFTK